MDDLTCSRGCVVITAESRRRHSDVELFEIDVDDVLAEHDHEVHGGRRPPGLVAA